MPTPIKIFICYKKMLSGERPNEKAGILHFILKQDQGRFDPGSITPDFLRGSPGKQKSIDESLLAMFFWF